MVPIPFVHFGIGLATALLSIPLVARKIPMNSIYGVRLRKGIVSEDNWFEINAYGGRLLLGFGVFLMLFAWLGGRFSPAPTSAMAPLFLILPLIGLAPVLMAINAFARDLPDRLAGRRFDSQGSTATFVSDVWAMPAFRAEAESGRVSRALRARYPVTLLEVIVIATFPFGRPIHKVVQTDRGPKRAFVLGVYASAVYARWIDEDGETLVSATAVASEPEIFWRGEGAEEIVASIEMPSGAGSLVPAGDNLNGTTGVALDERFLAPLGITRSETWMCDLVPYSCKTDRQAKALARAYDRCAGKLGLPAYDWPLIPDTLADAERRQEIAAELTEASPDLLITLGDPPLRWFASHFGAKGRLDAYGETREEYGRLREVRVGRRTMVLLPLAHPRQVARGGSFSAKLASMHEHWAEEVAPYLLVGGSR